MLSWLLPPSNLPPPFPRRAKNKKNDAGLLLPPPLLPSPSSSSLFMVVVCDLAVGIALAGVEVVILDCCVVTLLPLPSVDVGWVGLEDELGW